MVLDDSRFNWFKSEGKAAVMAIGLRPATIIVKGHAGVAQPADTQPTFLIRNQCQ